MKTAICSQQRLGFMAIAISTLLFSLKGVLVKKSYSYGIEPVTLMTLRMLMAFPLFVTTALVIRYRNKKYNYQAITIKEWCLIGCLAIMGYYLANFFDLIGLQYVSAGMERLVLYLNPSFVIILSAIFLKEKMEKSLLLPFFLCYGGITMTFMNDMNISGSGGLFGMFMVAMAALCFAVFLIGNKSLLKKIGPVSLASYGMLISSGAILIHFMIKGGGIHSLKVHNHIYLYTLFMAIFSTFFPVFLMTWGLKLISASRVSVIGSMGPVVTIIISWFVLNESLVPAQIAGIALVMAGGIFLGIKK
ncbi:MAG: EamA family transporter [Fibrobacteria bacterium]|nr:EamA family transporter [Fibrobacteria bacterium]